MQLNLPPVLMCELLINNLTKKIEARETHLFTNYCLIANTEINLPPVWWCVKIQKFTKRKRSISKFYNQPKADTETTLPPILMMCEVWVRNNFRYVKHQKWFIFDDWHTTLKQNSLVPLMTGELLRHTITKESETWKMNHLASY